jgi:hypothetical protein
MAMAEVKGAALRDLDLLQSVVEFKMRFYPRGWAQYELAKPGTLKLIPPEHVLAEIRRDYAAMQIMIYGEVLQFDDIMEILRKLENEINALGEQGA